MNSDVATHIPLLECRSETDPSPIAIDVQGSFRKFAIFKSNGEVVVGDQDFLAQIESSGSEEIKAPELIPALQNSGVIQVSFGDYVSSLHFLFPRLF
jgi:SCF-associated factor 1